MTLVHVMLAAAALLTPHETELKAKLPEIFAKAAAHYRALDAAATPLMRDASGIGGVCPQCCRVAVCLACVSPRKSETRKLMCQLSW